MQEEISVERTLTVRSLRFPLKIKILFVILALLMAALGLFVEFSTRLVRNDKEAYIYETGLSAIEVATSNFENEIKQTENESQKIMAFISRSVDLDSEKINSLLRPYQNLLFFEIHRSVTEKLNYISPELDSMGKDFTRDEILKEINEQAFLKQDDIHLLKNFKWGPAYLIKIVDQITTETVVMLYKLPIAQGLMNPDGPFALSFYNEKGEHWWGAKFVHEELISELLQNAKRYKSGVKNIIGKDSVLAAYQIFLGPKNQRLIGIASIPGDKAYHALYLLIQKSWSFGLMVLGVSLIVGLFFSRALTKKLALLTKASLEMAKGQFDITTNIKGHDEVGVLGDTFNFMSAEIVHYMKEMEEKVRLQKEMEFAKLVQSRFLPNKLQLAHFDLQSFNQSASECGGDWWGIYQKEERDCFVTVLAIGDATGHGAPAALVASCAHSSFYTLKNTYPHHGELEAHELMTQLNLALCYSGEKVQMTMALFVIITSREGEVIRASYCNASHLPTYYAKTNDGPIAKDKIKVVGPASLGPRLGESSDSKYTSEAVSLEVNDLLFFHTDGLYEISTIEGEETQTFNQRKFLQFLIAQNELDSSTLSDNLLKYLLAFQNKDDQLISSDDVTYLWLRFKGAGQVVQKGMAVGS